MSYDHDSLRVQRAARAPAGATSSMPVFSRLLESTWSSTASTSGSTRTRPTTSACWATRRSLSRSSGHNSKIPGLCGPRQRPELPRLNGVCGHVQRRGALLYSASLAESAPRPCGQRRSSASITTRTSIRPRTCNTSPGRTARGSASTGATTAAWWPARCRARAEIAATARMGPTASWTYPGITPDQQAQAGLFCGCACSRAYACKPNGHPTKFLSRREPLSGKPIRVAPRKNTGRWNENDDTNPPRIQQRNLFDLAVGDDNVFKGDRFKWSARFTVLNLANEYALYNFISTFSGTHYVSPRTFTGQIGFHF